MFSVTKNTKICGFENSDFFEKMCFWVLWKEKNDRKRKNTKTENSTKTFLPTTKTKINKKIFKKLYYKIYKIIKNNIKNTKMLLFGFIFFIETFAVTTEEICGEDCVWKYDTETKTMTFTGSGKIDDFTYESLPLWQQHHKETETLVIDDKFTEIGNYVFYLFESIKTVTLPSALERIGDYAFYYCSQLEEITLPSTLKTIGIAAFTLNEKLTKITIPASVKRIETQAFASCFKLSSVTI